MGEAMPKGSDLLGRAALDWRLHAPEHPKRVSTHASSSPSPEHTDYVDLLRIESVPDDDLSRALAIIRGELERRALDAADPEALTEEGFTIGFTSKGLPVDPWVRSGILVCPGGKVDHSAMRHSCGFVRVDENWVWESPSVISDVVRYGTGPRPSMRSVSLVPVPDGTKVDLVLARTRAGVHELDGVRSFVVEDQQLSLVSSRFVKSVSHRS